MTPVRTTRVGAHPLAACDDAAFHRPLAYILGRQASLVSWPGEKAAMPTYRYHCVRCEETFERVEGIPEHGTNKPRCPKCGGEEVVQVPAPFVALTAKKS